MKLTAACTTMLVGLVMMAIVVGLDAGEAVAWGPHSKITQAALQVLPDSDRWKSTLGEDNLAALANYCLLPDQRDQDLGAFYANDYLLIRQMPHHAGHCMPAVQETFAPYFRRALQALRTETPVNACRQIGPLLHFVEDVGAPPHAKERCPHHTELENWVRADQIVITGYKPQLLGKTDDEALAGLLARVAALVEFSKARAERALPLVSQPKPDRMLVEPILLESALESARATADVLYTIFTLGLAPQPEGASLTGTVTAAPLPLRDDHGARIVLLDTDYATLAVTPKPRAEGSAWQGSYTLHHLPPGTYRVLAYRTASQYRISEPITLEAGKPAKLDVSLPAAEPAGNIVENPTGQLAYLQSGAPDRWKAAPTAKPTIWLSFPAWVKPGTTYRCGAALKDPAAKVSFRFLGKPGKDGKTPPPVVCPLEMNGKSRAELTTIPDAQRREVVVQVQSSRPLAEVIESVWVVPEVQKPVATHRSKPR
jgi:hypothetical protein